jgi:Fe-S oxidoreductase
LFEDIYFTKPNNHLFKGRFFKEKRVGKNMKKFLDFNKESYKVKHIAERCLGKTDKEGNKSCSLCIKECEMLKALGKCPGELFRDLIQSGEIDSKTPYLCNMCSMCSLVCPEKLDIKEAFLDIRKEIVKNNEGKSPIKGHKTIDVHQKLSFSKLFNTTQKIKIEEERLHIKSVFMPGCSLPSYKPELVENILAYLQEKVPRVGTILKCCGKPTKIIGQEDLFLKRYENLQAEFNQVEAEEVIVACQNCYSLVSEYSPKQKVVSLWTLLKEIGLPESAKGIGNNSDIVFAIHDSCPTRNVSEIHDSVRWIMNELGYKVEEPPHSREKTRCCGFGGMAAPASPELAQKVMKRRTSEVKSDYMITYCAGCREAMTIGGKKTLHLLDLIFGDTYHSKSEFPGGQTAVQNWVNRYKSKKVIQKAYK